MRLRPEHHEVLVHYSSQPVGAIYSKSQDGDHFKPEGLWVSVENFPDNWREWCTSEDFAVESLRFPYDVTLSPTANILRLRTAGEILAFSDEYRKDSSHWYRIDWTRVANKYDGIIIAPYCWALRLDSRTSWYYSWDCASGCIWNSDAIGSVAARVEVVECRQ